MSNNPYIIPVLKLLQQSPQGLSEYELMQQLDRLLGDAENDAGLSSLDLFKKHFMLMNALYRLRDELAIESMWVQISPLLIQLEPLVHAQGEELSVNTADASLQAYYLDWRNLQETGADELENMLDGFWQHYHAGDKRAQALLVLGLDGDARWVQIKRRYHQLITEHHPDKGGDADLFVEIRKAFETLRSAVKQ